MGLSEMCGGLSARVCCLWLGLAVGLGGHLSGADSGSAIVINGLGGMPEYEENFVEWATRFKLLFDGQFGDDVYYVDGRVQRKDDVLEAFRKVAGREAGPVWLVLIGHANHDGENYKFNIRGPDLTDSELADFLSGLGSRVAYLVAGTSASGTLTSSLGGPNRVIVSATKNQFERQPPLFPSFLLEATTSAQADRDKNGRISLLEAFLFSRLEVSRWFGAKGLLQTEHSRLDDQGRFQLGDLKDDEAGGSELNTGTGYLSAVAYLSSPPEQAYRSAQAQELAQQRQVVEREIEALKFRKQELATAEYYQQLEALLVRLAEMNEQIKQLEGSDDSQG